MKLKRFTGVVLAISLLLSGCQLDMADTGTDTPKSRYIDTTGAVIFSDYTHFISAPEVSFPGSKITNYEASYKMTVQDTNACFVLGSSKGEYGELYLCEIDAPADLDDAFFTVKKYDNGCYREEEDSLAFPKSEDNNYDVSLAVLDGKLAVNINGTELASFDAPSFELGVVGVYKSRETSTALIDDIKVTSDGRTIFSDDFDGEFTNELYEYNYQTEATSAFSPYFIKTKDNDGI